MKRVFVLIAILSLFLLSCRKNNCDTISPIEPEIAFTIVDQNTGKSLIGTDRQYPPDSIHALNTGSFHINFNISDTVVLYYYGNLPSGSAQPFRLSENEIDTLQINYFIEQTECFSLKTVSEFYYNDSLVQKNSPYTYNYVVLK